MKIIAFYTGEYPNGYAPMSIRLHFYLKALKSKGVEVEVVMPSDSDETDGIFEGIPYSFFRAAKRSRFNSFKVADEYANICKSLAQRSDLVFTTITQNLFLSKIANKIHCEKGRIAIELNENPYSAFGRRTDTRLGLFLERQYFLRKTLKKTDGVIVISKALSNLVSNHCRNGTPVVTIPILSEFKEFNKSNEYSGRPYILHAGALSEVKDGIRAMLKAFAIAHEKLGGNLQFVFTSKITFPSLLNWINNFIKQNHLEEDVIFKGLVPKEELDELYAGCALAIVNKPSNAQNNFNFPTKLTELLPREIPVIVSGTGVMNDYFEDHINAFVVEANNVGQIAEKIIYIREHSPEAAEVAHNGRLLAEKEFYYLNYSDILLEFFEHVAQT